MLLKSFLRGAFFRSVFPLSLMLLFLGNALPASAHSLTQSAQDPNSTACSAPIVQTVGNGSLDGYSCFYKDNVLGFDLLNIRSQIMVSFSSSQPQEWKQCTVWLEAIDTTSGNDIVPYTGNHYDCLREAKNSSQEVLYGNDIGYALNGSFMPRGQHTYQVIAEVEYQYGNGASQILLIESQLYSG